MIGQISAWLFDPSGLSPHGYCLLWQPGLLLLHAISDAGIGLAYFTIPFTLLSITQFRPDIGFRPQFILFAAFILLCGAGHFLDVLTLWVPIYGFEGVVKAATATVSVLTAISLWRLMPAAVHWPTPVQMDAIGEKLKEVEQARVAIAAIARDAAQSRDDLAAELARRQEVERSLAESEERFRLLAQNGGEDAFYLLDADGRVETWNTGAMRLKQYAAAEVIGQHFAVFFTPEDIAAGEPARLLEVARSEGKCLSEGWRVRKDGTRFLARAITERVIRPDGTLRGFSKRMHDVTAEQIEQAQRAIIIEAAPNGMIIVNEAGDITLANAQVGKIFGYAPGALIGQSVSVVVPEWLEALRAGLRSRLITGEDVRGMATGREFFGRRQDGSAVAIDILLQVVQTPQGRIVVASLFDTSERARLAAERQAKETRERMAIEQANANLDQLSRHLAKARDRAERANRAKSRFLAGMSHELRTPLNGIMGYANLLQMDGGLNPVQSERVAAMLDAGKHLLEMIACVLDLSEIEAEHVTLRPVVINPRDTIAACLDLVRPTADAKGLALIAEPAPHLPQSWTVDPTRLRQILLNLLGNAVKFTANGQVRVMTTVSDDRATLRIAVADTGPGIPELHRERLFQDFERYQAEPATLIEGAGIGLALSRRLAGLMGGRIGYDENPGGGSVFWLELPMEHTASLTPDGAAPLPQRAALQPAVARVLRVLVVDDLAMNRDITASFLRADKHVVTCAAGGQQAIDAVRETDFDLVLMDVRMPGMDGMEATRRIRALPGHAA